MKGAFAKLGDNIRQVEYGELGAGTARYWLGLSPEQRAMIGVIAPTRALRDDINATTREGLVAEGAISGPARKANWAPRSVCATNSAVGRTGGWRRLGAGSSAFRRLATPAPRAVHPATVRISLVFLHQHQGCRTMQFHSKRRISHRAIQVDESTLPDTLDRLRRIRLLNTLRTEGCSGATAL